MTRGYLIPNDWDSTSYHLWVFCAPASQDWDSIVRGAMLDLTRGRSWDASTGSITDTQTIAREMYDTMAICDELVAALQGIETAINGLNVGGSACSCEGGSQLEESPSDGQVDIGPGERFPDQATYDTAKCRASNGIYDTIKNAIDDLKIYDVDTLGSGGISLAVGLVTTLIASGPIGWGVALVLGAVSGLVTLLLSGPAFDLNDISQIWDDNQQDLVCEFYTGADTASSRAAVLLLLDSLGANTFEQSFVGLLMTETLINQLFNEMTDDTENYISPNPIDCSTCPVDTGCPWVWSIAGGLGGSGDLTKDGTERVLTATQGAGGFYRVHVEMDTSTGNPGQACDGEVFVNSEYQIMSYTPTVPTFTTVHPWYWVGSQRTNPGNWPVPPTQDVRYASELVWTDDAPFTVNIKLNPGNFPG